MWGNQKMKEELFEPLKNLKWLESPEIEEEFAEAMVINENEVRGK